MSWIVETLLLEQEQIRAKLDIESDEYNDLLVIESKLKYLVSEGMIDPFEQVLLEYIITNKSFSALEKILGVGRSTLSNYFSKICNKISYSLGGYFTNEGYLKYMKETHKLNDEQVEKIRKHITSRYKHTIRRKSA